MLSNLKQTSEIIDAINTELYNWLEENSNDPVDDGDNPEDRVVTNTTGEIFRFVQDSYIRQLEEISSDVQRTLEDREDA